MFIERTAHTGLAPQERHMPAINITLLWSRKISVDTFGCQLVLHKRLELFHVYLEQCP